MGTFFAFLGTLLLSQFVALLAALQLADFFRATEEFIAVMIGLMVFALIAVVLFAVVHNIARTTRAFQVLAFALVFAVLILLALPGAITAYSSRSWAPLSVGDKDVPVLLELTIPALLTILVQWGLVRRRWLKRRGADDLSRWPWVTTIIAGLAILNPAGLSAVSSAARLSGIEGLRDTTAAIGLGMIAALIVIVLIEIAVRGRILRRRQPAPL